MDQELHIGSVQPVDAAALWNNAMAIILAVRRQIENHTSSIDAFLHEEQSH